MYIPVKTTQKANKISVRNRLSNTFRSKISKELNHIKQSLLRFNMSGHKLDVIKLFPMAPLNH